MEIDTPSGPLVFKETSGGGWRVENDDGSSTANIIEADIAAQNGVVHLLDAVLLPPAAPLTTSSTGSSTGLDNIVGIAASTPELSNLVQAVTAAGLADTLQGKGPFTLMAPTNNAWGSVKNFNKLLKDKEALTEILMLHVAIGQAIFSTDLGDLDVASMNALTTIASPRLLSLRAIWCP